MATQTTRTGSRTARLAMDVQVGDRVFIPGMSARHLEVLATMPTKRVGYPMVEIMVNLDPHHIGPFSTASIVVAPHHCVSVLQRKA